MSEPTSNDYNTSPRSIRTAESLEYAVTHLFLPVKLPEKSDYTLEKDLSLAHAVCAAAHAYVVHGPEKDRWGHIAKMLDNLRASAQSECLYKDRVVSQLRGMCSGDTLTFFCRPQNAAIVLTKREDCTICELFEVSPSSDAVEKAPGSLICTYPWSAAEIPNKVFEHEDFASELATFLSPCSAVRSNHSLFHVPHGSPQYITALLSGILRAVGRTTDVIGVTKRIRDNVGEWPQKSDLLELLDRDSWRRSSLWLLIKVAIQMANVRSPSGRVSYKQFVLYFLCTLAIDRETANLPSDHLHLMSSKIFQRLNKLGSSTPDWLSKRALETCTRLREILDTRWKQLGIRPSPFRNPSQDELVRDTKLSLLNSGEYIRDVLANANTRSPGTSFDPSHRLRGTLEDFLSSNGSFFDEACAADPKVALYDLEWSIEHEMDDWLACVADTDNACAQLEILMDKYVEATHKARFGDPERASIIILTTIELFIALDKLAVKKIPMLAEYSPEVPIECLEELCLRKSTSLHRLSCAYMYLSARYSQSRPGWSVLSTQFTEDSLPLRYYAQCPRLQQLKDRIEQERMVAVAMDTDLPGSHDEHQKQQTQSTKEDVKLSQSLFPIWPLYAKIVVFELHCPGCIRIWRSAVARVHNQIDFSRTEMDEKFHLLLAHVPGLQPYYVERQGPPLHIQIRVTSMMAYVLEQSRINPDGTQEDTLRTWRPSSIPHPGYGFSSGSRSPKKYVNSTSHTSNDVLAAQADCPAGLSLHEFITFAHLRSGSSLQWLNILHGLHSRTLNLHHPDVHSLLSHAIFQVGPLDLNTGMWIWHQELQDTSFCNPLLDELSNLFADRVGLVDGVLMSSISLLLARVLASSPSGDVSEQAILLLQRIRSKTFSWVQELSYDLVMAPAPPYSWVPVFLYMAAACRSTFDVDHTTLRKLCRSAEDIDALLYCTFVQGLSPNYVSSSEALLRRDGHLSPTFEETLRDTILADPSDYGIDLAVSRVFMSYWPGVDKWEPLRYPDYHWLTCKTKPLGDKPTQAVHVNLLDGSIRVNGKSFGSLLDSDLYSLHIGNHRFSVASSDLPGMDFTLPSTLKYKVHFSLQDDKVVVRTGSSRTDMFELIPREKLRQDLPPALLDGHLHWLNLSTSTIEISEIFKQPFEESPENWRIDCTPGCYCLYKGHETMVDIRSPTWAMISKCFDCLDVGERDIMISTSKSPVTSGQFPLVHQLSVALPRYGLSFFINEDEELESRDFKDMVYDENQCIGTLFGLEHILVLRPKAHLSGLPTPEALIHRRVLAVDDIPKKWRTNDSVNRSHFSYCTYVVDTELGCLLGNGSLESMQLLAYLHASTACHCPDPLTGQMGTQMGLHLLQSAACRSTMQSMLCRAPGTIWSSTGHPQINIVSEEIERRRHPSDQNFAEPTPKSTDKRAAQRAMYLFPSNITAPIPVENAKDTEYPIPGFGPQQKDAIFTMAAAVLHWSVGKPNTDTLLNWADLLNGVHTQVVKDSPFSPLLDKSGIWLDRNFVQKLIIKVRGILVKEEIPRWIQLSFLLPTVLYGSLGRYHQAAILSLLVALVGDSLVPADCNISDGYRPTKEILQDYIHKFFLKKDDLHRLFHDSAQATTADTAMLQLVTHLHQGTDNLQWLRDLPTAITDAAGERLRMLKDHLQLSCDQAAMDAAIECLLKEWPCNTVPTIPLDPDRWDVPGLTASLQRLFSSYHRNWSLKEHLTHILTKPASPTLPLHITPVHYTSTECTEWQVTLGELLSNRPTPQLPLRSTLTRLGDCQGGNSAPTTSNNIPVLDRLFSSIQTSSAFQRDYVARLEVSAGMCKESQTTSGVSMKDRLAVLQKHYTECRTNYMDALDRLKHGLGPITDHERMLEQFNHWPPITADLLLRCLAAASPIDLPRRWKKCLISFALLLLELQRARRLLQFALDGLEDEFLKEFGNEQCDGWNPEEYPDWLLIQVQGNFLVRRAQAETAMEMIYPKSGNNTVMQVNIGEGKSSVIIPITAVALADGKRLVRVIVPKALTVQMFELLVARLGGLTNRPIYHMPFSRAEKKSLKVGVLHKFLSQCISERGILLIQPEHAVSLKLACIEEQINAGKYMSDLLTKPIQKSVYKHIKNALSLQSFPKDGLVGRIFQWLSLPAEQLRTRDISWTDHHGEQSGITHSEVDGASEWANLQMWIQTHARDILDESDEVLHSRFQLVYTVGLKQRLDGYPDRWTITQRVLQLAKVHIQTLCRNHPNSVEHESGPPGSFPRIRIVQTSNVGRYLISMIVEDIMAGMLPDCDFRYVSPELRDAIRSFISDEDAPQVADTVKRVEKCCKDAEQSYPGLRNRLLLLRGLLSSKVLLFALTEWRWRVDYGLLPRPGYPHHSPAESSIAIPYRAKDTPAPGNIQFGHPDIAIILTCLSYYYSGLTEEQLRVAFQILLDQDDPYKEYATWIEEYDGGLLPDSLQRLTEVNLNSSEQWDRVVFPLFSLNQATINFYLARVVFPAEATEFPLKICGSNWDIAEKRENLVTGFSGTNDGCLLLPMSVTHYDVDHQRGTNARVLAHLLRPENDFYMMTHQNGEQPTTLEFLELIATQTPEIRVLLDVGAQILDSSNTQVAMAWLNIVRTAVGAVYFDDSEYGELMVLERNSGALGRRLSLSPLSQRLDSCVVYLDHAHTRGTDLKLPIGSRGAVTLGPKVTKDALVQGCMRMRKLGRGHSVMFFAPPGVDQSIRVVTGKKDQTTRVTTADVLCWAIQETCNDIQQRAPYWAQQGLDHKRRYDSWIKFCQDNTASEQLFDAWLQPDRKSLTDLYAPREIGSVKTRDLSAVPGMQQRCKDLGVLSLPLGQLEEEQEREVNRERERERQAELPPPARPAKHSLHPDVVAFVRTGVIPPLHPGSAFLPVFTTLENNSTVTWEAGVWSSSILATVDFSITIELGSTKGTMDQYLRPVQWILSGRTDHDPVLVLLSQFEADRLMPDIRVSKHVHLHLYAPRTLQSMKPSDDLRFYSIPPLPSDWTPPWDLIDQLNVFAGQLYLRDYQSYLRLCRFLDVPTKESRSDTVKTRRNLFYVPGSFEETEITFSDSPLPYVMALLAIRNGGRPFDQSHMGKILQGQLLTEKDFEGKTSGASSYNSSLLYNEQSGSPCDGSSRY